MLNLGDGNKPYDPGLITAMFIKILIVILSRRVQIPEVIKNNPVVDVRPNLGGDVLPGQSERSPVADKAKLAVANSNTKNK